ncbi:MAG: carboxypeptidase regulatory-like domain-containing protein [Candidatus Omnitrophota bacterium]
MFLKIRKSVYLIVCVLCLFCSGMASPPAVKTIISGYVRDAKSRQPVLGVKVQLVPLIGKEKSSTTTNDTGYYELKDLIFPVFGSYYDLKFSKDGYRSKKERKFFKNGKNYPFDVSLTTMIIVPPAPPVLNRPPVINSFSPADNSEFLAGAKIGIKVSASDADNDPLLYQFSVGGSVQQAWSGLSNYSWQTTHSDTGAVNLTCEVKDSNGVITSKLISCRIINPTAEEILQKVSDNYKKIGDLKADMLLSAALDGESIGAAEYCRYYFKAPVKIGDKQIPTKEKTETYSDGTRNTLSDIIIIDGNYMYRIDASDQSVEKFDLLEQTGISAEQLNHMDIYYNPDNFFQTHTVKKDDAKTDFNNMIIALEAVPKTQNNIYARLELYSDYKKGILAKNILYKRDEENSEPKLLQTIETKESIKMANGAWVPVKMIKIPVLSSGNMISTMVYSHIEINTGLKDDDFDSDKQ